MLTLYTTLYMYAVYAHIQVVFKKPVKAVKT